MYSWNFSDQQLKKNYDSFSSGGQNESKSLSYIENIFAIKQNPYQNKRGKATIVPKPTSQKDDWNKLRLYPAKGDSLDGNILNRRELYFYPEYFLDFKKFRENENEEDEEKELKEITPAEMLHNEQFGKHAAEILFYLVENTFVDEHLCTSFSVVKHRKRLNASFIRM